MIEGRVNDETPGMRVRESDFPGASAPAFVSSEYLASGRSVGRRSRETGEEGGREAGEEGRKK